MKDTALIFLIHGEELYEIFSNCLISLFKIINPALDVIIYCSALSYEMVKKASSNFDVKIIQIDLPANPVSSEYKNWGTQEFKKVVSNKWRMIINTLEKGYTTVIYSDCDIVFIRDFYPYIKAASDVHMLGLQSAWGGKFPQKNCTGFMFFTTKAKTFLQKLNAFNQTNRNNLGDEGNFNIFVREFKNRLIRKEMLTLPESQFQNGLYYWGRMQETETPDYLLVPDKQWKPFLFHANWVLGVDNKIKYLKCMSMWYLD